jgi:hypothetical protein
MRLSLAAKDGNISIFVTLLTIMNRNCTCFYTVRDRRKGIEPEITSRLFEKFITDSKSSKAKNFELAVLQVKKAKNKNRKSQLEY